MPQHTFESAIAAGATVNPMAGTLYEYLPFPADVEIGLITTATGILATISSGPDLLAEEQPIQYNATARLPIYPDDFLWNDEAAQGDKLQIRLRNTTGGSLTCRGCVRITPLA